MTSTQITRAQDVLDFWFAPETEPFWWQKSTEFDARMRDLFAALLERPALMDSWPLDGAGMLARIIVFDQAPRNIFRDTPNAFAFDETARRYCRLLLLEGLDRQLADKEKAFAYLPLEHSEDIGDQEDCLHLMQTRIQDQEPANFAKAHLDIIARFGRFPHRNAILGRASTAEELAFLEQPGSSF